MLLIINIVETTENAIWMFKKNIAYLCRWLSCAYFLLLDLVTWMYLLMSTVYDIKEYQCQGTRPQRTDITLSSSIVLRLSAFWCTCLSYSFIAIVLSLHTLHASSIKPHDTISILCTYQSQFKPLHSATDICSVSRTNTLTLRRLMSYIYIYGAPILDVSRSHTTTQHSR